MSSVAISDFFTIFPFISANNQEKRAIESYRTNVSQGMPSMKLPQQFCYVHTHCLPILVRTKPIPSAQETTSFDGNIYHLNGEILLQTLHNWDLISMIEKSSTEKNTKQ